MFTCQLKGEGAEPSSHMLFSVVQMFPYRQISGYQGDLTECIVGEMGTTSSGRLVGAGLSMPWCVSGSIPWCLNGRANLGRLVTLSES